MTDRGIHHETCAEFHKKSFTPREHQKRTLKDFLANPYRGVVLYHKLGSGKSCSAIMIMDALFKLTVSGSGSKPHRQYKHIYVITPGFLRENFVQEYCLKCGYDATTLRKHISFVTYNTSVHLKDSLDDCIIVVDEVHNLIRMKANGAKTGSHLYNRIIESKRSKIIALTGTPLGRNLNEFMLLINLLRPGSLTVNMIPRIPQAFADMTQQANFDAEAVDNYRFDFEPDVVARFQNAIAGLISYFSPAVNTADMPEVIHEDPVLCRMCIGHSVGLVEMMKFEDKIIMLKPKAIKGMGTDMSTHQIKLIKILAAKRVFSRKYSNFWTYGLKSEKIKRITDLYQYAKDNKIYVPGDFEGLKPEDFADVNLRQKTFHAQTNPENGEIIDIVDDSPPDLLSTDKPVAGWITPTTFQSSQDNDSLELLSPKMFALLSNIARHFHAKHLVYSFFKERSGIVLLSSLLKKCGISHAVLSGSVPFAQRKKIMKIYNSNHSNLHGEKLKVLLITDAGAEGINLMAVQHVHLLESTDRPNLHQQVIGRATRFQSHINLPPNERFVHVWRYWSVLSWDDNGGIDRQLYRKGLVSTAYQNALLKLIADFSIENGNTKHSSRFKGEVRHQNIIALLSNLPSPVETPDEQTDMYVKVHYQISSANLMIAVKTSNKTITLLYTRNSKNPLDENTKSNIIVKYDNPILKKKYNHEYKIKDHPKARHTFIDALVEMFDGINEVKDGENVIITSSLIPFTTPTKTKNVPYYFPTMHRDYELVKDKEKQLQYFQTTLKFTELFDQRAEKQQEEAARANVNDVQAGIVDDSDEPSSETEDEPDESNKSEGNESEETDESEESNKSEDNESEETDESEGDESEDEESDNDESEKDEKSSTSSSSSSAKPAKKGSGTTIRKKTKKTTVMSIIPVNYIADEDPRIRRHPLRRNLQGIIKCIQDLASPGKSLFVEKVILVMSIEIKVGDYFTYYINREDMTVTIKYKKDYNEYSVSEDMAEEAQSKMIEQLIRIKEDVPPITSTIVLGNAVDDYDEIYTLNKTELNYQISRPETESSTSSDTKLPSIGSIEAVLTHKKKRTAAEKGRNAVPANTMSKFERFLNRLEIVSDMTNGMTLVAGNRQYVVKTINVTYNDMSIKIKEGEWTVSLGEETHKFSDSSKAVSMANRMFIQQENYSQEFQLSVETTKKFPLPANVSQVKFGNLPSLKKVDEHHVSVSFTL